MQIVVHVMARASLTESLREIVIRDLQKWDFQLEVESEKKIGRKSGWAKIKAKDLTGAINIYWHASSKTLIVRVVGKKEIRPQIWLGALSATCFSIENAMLVISRSAQSDLLNVWGLSWNRSISKRHSSAIWSPGRVGI